VATDSVLLRKDQRLELSRIAQSRSLPAGYVFRARLILMLAEGASFNTIKERLGTTAPTISRWKQRFVASGIDGLDSSAQRMIKGVPLRSNVCHVHSSVTRRQVPIAGKKQPCVCTLMWSKAPRRRQLQKFIANWTEYQLILVMLSPLLTRACSH
jgi:uncharacterized protein YerC